MRKEMLGYREVNKRMARIPRGYIPFAPLVASSTQHVHTTIRTASHA